MVRRRYRQRLTKIVNVLKEQEEAFLVVHCFNQRVNQYFNTIKLGISTINIEFPPNTTQIDVTAKYLDTETKNHLRKSYRESSQYIQIKPLVERLVKEN